MWCDELFHFIFLLEMIRRLGIYFLTSKLSSSGLGTMKALWWLQKDELMDYTAGKPLKKYAYMRLFLEKSSTNNIN